MMKRDECFQALAGQLNGEIVKVLEMPGVRQRLSSHGFDPAGDTPQEFADFINADIEKWATILTSPSPGK